MLLSRHFPVVHAEANVLLARKVLHAGTFADKASPLAMLLCCVWINIRLLLYMLCASLTHS